MITSPFLQLGSEAEVMMHSWVVRTTRIFMEDGGQPLSDCSLSLQTFPRSVGSMPTLLTLAGVLSVIGCKSKQLMTTSMASKPRQGNKKDRRKLRVLWWNEIEALGSFSYLLACRYPNAGPSYLEGALFVLPLREQGCVLLPLPRARREAR